MGIRNVDKLSIICWIDFRVEAISTTAQRPQKIIFTLIVVKSDTKITISII